MILLESHNVIIKNVLTDRFVKPSKVDIQFVDYDATRFHLSTPTSKTSLILSMGIRCWTDLVKYGVQSTLESEYGSWVLSADDPEKEPGYDVTLRIDLNTIPEEGVDRESMIDHISFLKPTVLSAPFHLAFNQHAELAKSHQANFQASQSAADQPAEGLGEIMAVRYREEEAIYIQPSWDRVTVVFSTVFKEETDRVFGKVFLQEFVDARRLPSIQNAPQVLYSNREPPLEIRSFPGLKRTEEVGYVTFVLFPRHFATPEIAHETILRIQLFRDYLHYHIKCSKAYMHSRMRHRVAEFLKILNRAKPEVQGTGERKTATGRTFRTR